MGPQRGFPSLVQGMFVDFQGDDVNIPVLSPLAFPVLSVGCPPHLMMRCYLPFLSGGHSIYSFVFAHSKLKAWLLWVVLQTVQSMELSGSHL